MCRMRTIDPAAHLACAQCVRLRSNRRRMNSQCLDESNHHEELSMTLRAGRSGASEPGLQGRQRHEERLQRLAGRRRPRAGAAADAPAAAAAAHARRPDGRHGVKPSINRRCTPERDFKALPCASGYQALVTVCREQPVVNRLTADASERQPSGLLRS